MKMKNNIKLAHIKASLVHTEAPLLLKIVGLIYYKTTTLTKYSILLPFFEVPAEVSEIIFDLLWIKKLTQALGRLWIQS